jgi:hypothetical protein
VAASTEQEPRAPTTLTLRLLGVVAAFTFLPWLGGKVACNDPAAGRLVPFELPGDAFARNAKSAALELQQRASSERYREAAELASGALREQLLASAAECESTPGACQARRAQSERIATRAVLVALGAGEARVRAESRLDQQLERFTLQVRQTGERWSVVSRTPFEGELEAPLSPAEAAAGPARAEP